MKENKYTEYDHSEFYEKEIKPLADEIMKKCKLRGLPFVFSCAPVNLNGTTKYEHTCNLTGSNELVLYEDNFEQFLAALTKFKLVPIASLAQMDEDIAEGSAGYDYINTIFEE